MHEKRLRPRKRRAKPAPSALLAARERKGEPEANRDNSLCGVALLRIALELKKSGRARMDEVVSAVLARMGLSGEAFREYLAKEDLLRRLERLSRRER